MKENKNSSLSLNQFIESQKVDFNFHNNRAIINQSTRYRKQSQNSHYVNSSNSSTDSTSNCQNKKNKINFEQADINDFAKGISDMKVAYEPYFGHQIINYGEKVNLWKELSKNILNIYAPKHSVLLEIIKNQKIKEEIEKQKQKEKEQKLKLLQRRNKNQANNDELQQRLLKQLTVRRLSQLVIEKQKSAINMENEVFSNLRQSKFGSKNFKKDGNRSVNRHYALRLNDLKQVEIQTLQLLKDHNQSFDFFQRFNQENQHQIKKASSTQCLQRQKKPINQQNENQFLGYEIIANDSTQKSPKNKSQSSQYQKSQKQNQFMQKIFLQGQEKRKYFETFQPSFSTLQLNASTNFKTPLQRTNNENKNPARLFPILSKQMNKTNTYQSLHNSKDKTQLPLQLQESQQHLKQFDPFKTIQEDRQTQDVKFFNGINSQICSPISTANVSLIRPRTIKDIKGIYDKEIDEIKQRKRAYQTQRINLQMKIRNRSRMNILRQIASTQGFVKTNDQLLQNEDNFVFDQ